MARLVYAYKYQCQKAVPSPYHLPLHTTQTGNTWSLITARVRCSGLTITNTSRREAGHTPYRLSASFFCREQEHSMALPSIASTTTGTCLTIQVGPATPCIYPVGRIQRFVVN